MELSKISEFKNISNYGSLKQPDNTLPSISQGKDLSAYPIPPHEDNRREELGVEIPREPTPPEPTTNSAAVAKELPIVDEREGQEKYQAPIHAVSQQQGIKIGKIG